MTEKRSAMKRARAKLLRRPIGVEVQMAILCDKHGRPLTGEPVGVLALQHPIDRRSMRERRFTIGTQLRAQLDRDRNPGFWRKAHVLGGWLADNLDEFAGLDMHEALKRLQVLSHIGCEYGEWEVQEDDGTLTKVRGWKPLSLNFTDMDEGEFQALWSGADGEGGWMGWLRSEKWSELSRDQINEVEDLIAGDRG